MRVAYHFSAIPDIVAVAKNLQRMGWEPCYFVLAWEIDPPCAKDALREFPDAIHHNFWQLIRGILPIDIETMPPLDAQTIEKFAKYESTAFSMMDRMDAGYTFNFRERQRLYYRLLRYWLGIYGQLRPDITVFSSVPHEAASYLMYAVSLETGCRTIMFGHTPIPNLMYLCSRVGEEPNGLAEEYQRMLQGGQVSISPHIAEYAAKLRGDYSTAMPQDMRRLFPAKRDMANAYLEKLLQIRSWPHYAAALWNLRKTFPAVQLDIGVPETSYQKLRDFRVEDTHIPQKEWTRQRQKQIKRASVYKSMLKNHYAQLCENVDLDRPYVYLALHYQPESTSLPMGGCYNYQWLMVSLLSKTLPKGWLLYVKEHPAQFHPWMFGELGRSPTLYDDIKQLGNVRLVPIDYPPFELLDHAKAVATLTGTIGLEAVFRGLPALVFGSAWYRSCEGVFYVPSELECSRAMGRIEGGVVVDQGRVEAFLSALSKASFLAYTDSDAAKRNLVTFQENVDTLTRQLLGFKPASARS